MSGIYAAIRKGFVKLNGKKASAESKVAEGDKISVAAFLLEKNGEKTASSNIISSSDAEKTSPETIPPAQNVSFETVFQNEFVRIINKPYDIPVHGKNSLAPIIESLYRKENRRSSISFTPGPLHRLDRKTTGLLVFSNSLQGAVWFSNAVAERKIRKLYVGICRGTLSERIIWNDTIVPDESAPPPFHTMKIVATEIAPMNIAPTLPGGKKRAETIASPLAFGTYKNQDVTLCQFEILTGKKHQIRCQAAFHGIPLLGDTAYRAEKISEAQDFYLHAYKMIFPEDNPLCIPEEITAPLPENYEKFLTLSLLKWNGAIIL